MYITRNEIKKLLKQGYVFSIYLKLNNFTNEGNWFDYKYKDGRVQVRGAYINNFENTFHDLESISCKICPTYARKRKRIKIREAD